MNNTIVKEYKIIMDNNPQVREACEKGLSIFNNSMFKDNVDYYIVITDDKTKVHINFYPYSANHPYRAINLHNAYFEYFYTLNKQACCTVDLIK